MNVRTVTGNVTTEDGWEAVVTLAGTRHRRNKSAGQTDARRLQSVAYLCSAQAKFVTGQDIINDGVYQGLF